jgi:ATP-dependent DNA helicase RecQ
MKVTSMISQFGSSIEVLQQKFSLRDFRIGQQEIIQSVLAGQDVLAVLPTGGGKSLCYQLPAVQKKQLVIVISPLIALMKDQVQSLLSRGIPAACLHSGQSPEEKREIFRKLDQAGAFVLYLSPERVQKEGFRNWIQGRSIALFAVDEAHCVSQWGHDFREEYSQIKILKEIRPDIPVLALTASATPTVLQDIAKQLNLKDPQIRVHGFYRPNLYYQVEFCETDEIKLSFLNQALKQFPEGRVIIYCGTRKATESLAAQLSLHHQQVGFYHAGLTTDERTRTQQQYMQGQLRILVATNAFGMGIDQPNVRLVVHYQIPANIDSLYQEMGRAGRDGQDSTCLTLYAKKDKGLQGYFIQSSEARTEIKDTRWRNLESLVLYSEGSECRHAEILTYYKDAQRIERCGHCDRCLPKSERRIKKPLMPMVELAQTIQRLKTKAGLGKKKTNSDFVLDDVEVVRYELLKKWRREKAKELDVPSFVIFSDQTLKHLAAKNPQSLVELRSVYGIGDAKLEKFGWDILAELKA